MFTITGLYLEVIIVISVAMTTYNGEKYIKEQLLSILNQTVPVDEIVIYDDNSSDDTVQIIKKIIEENDSMTRIKLCINKNNYGFVRNFKKSINSTNGDYIFLADQDDIWEPNKVETMIMYMDELNASLLCSNYLVINECGKIISYKKPDEFKRLGEKTINRIEFRTIIWSNFIQGCTYCFTRDLKEKFLAIKNDEIAHDYQLLLLSSIMNSAYILNKELIRYRIHEANTIGLNHVRATFKINRIKPLMVKFLHDLDKITPVPYLHLYNILFYLKVPYFKALIKEALSGN